MAISIVQVDSFTQKPFAGNPAAVCVLPEARPERWMRAVAREMNLSETAFLVPENGGYHLRWFTPAVEVALCGHATLASAHVLWQDGHLAPGTQARFRTLSGMLMADQRGEWIEMNFPAKLGTPVEAPAGMLAALGVEGEALAVERNQFDYLVEVGSEERVEALAPDHSALRKVEARGIIVTAKASMPGYDFVSRFFAPGSGIDEDPVTGSAHCALGPYWMAQLGKSEFMAYQASARGGTLRVQVAGDRVLLSGQAVTVMRAELLA
ncbi:MAG TPA: PhzF family phenazine biosynthesis protein [Bryobacteraceae bacterium]|nr:PhzF family phenazine biosynthesis protein [Bryobacteraceae bacterium]